LLQKTPRALISSTAAHSPPLPDDASSNSPLNLLSPGRLSSAPVSDESARGGSTSNPTLRTRAHRSFALYLEVKAAFEPITYPK